jgi:hypothetical protein
MVNVLERVDLFVDRRQMDAAEVDAISHLGAD